MDQGHHHHHNPHHHHHHHQQLHQQQQPNISVSVDVTDRFPQWSLQETKELLIIRADLDQNFMETKRNKVLWEVISTRMKEKGFNRSPEQCKCKWKNLVTRYKGCETMEAEAVRQQFPFYNELQAIFAARMQRMLWAEAEGGGGSSSKKKAVAASVISSDEDDENDESEGDQKGTNTISMNSKKKKKMKSNTNHNAGTISSNSNNNLREVLEDFMKQQMQMEAQWLEVFEKRENERRLREMEWRQTMEALENERLMMERRWREREEQRRMREEARAEKRDALITALLNKLRREDI